MLAAVRANRTNELTHHASLIAGAIPAEVGSITTLRTLDLSTNQLDGELPLEVIRLKAKGCEVSLFGNRLGFSLPDVLASLGDDIPELDLSLCSLHGEHTYKIGAPPRVSNLTYSIDSRRRSTSKLSSNFA